VIDYRFATTRKINLYLPRHLLSLSAAKPQAEAQFVKLIKVLNDVGLTTEVRNGDNCAVLVFVKVASDRHLRAEVYRSRVQDWLYGVRTAAPEKEMQKNLDDEPVTEAERLRLAYLLITKPRNEGGAGITPKSGEWKGVESIFALHDHAFNKRWIKELTSKYFLNVKDLVEIKDRFGEKIGFSWDNFHLPMLLSMHCGEWFSLSIGRSKKQISQFSGVFVVFRGSSISGQSLSTSAW